MEEALISAIKMVPNAAGVVVIAWMFLRHLETANKAHERILSRLVKEVSKADGVEERIDRAEQRSDRHSSTLRAIIEEGDEKTKKAAERVYSRRQREKK